MNVRHTKKAIQSLPQVLEDRAMHVMMCGMCLGSRTLSCAKCCLPGLSAQHFRGGVGKYERFTDKLGELTQAFKEEEASSTQSPATRVQQQPQLAQKEGTAKLTPSYPKL